MTDKLNIKIRIAHLAPIPLKIQRHEEAIVRAAEDNVNKLFNEWSLRFSDRTPQELLAMVAFQFAKAFITLNQNAEQTDSTLLRLENALDSILNPKPGDSSRALPESASDLQR